MALSGLLLVAVVVASILLHQAQTKADLAMDAAMASHQAYTELEKTTHELQHQLAMYAATGDETKRATAAQLQKQYGDRLIFIEHWVAGEEDKGYLISLQRIYSLIQTGMQAIKPDMPLADRQNAANHLVNDVIEPEIINTIHPQCEVKQTALEKAKEIGHPTHAGAWLLLLGGLGSLGGLLGGYSLVRRFQKEMMELSVPIRNAAGSLSALSLALFS